MLGKAARSSNAVRYSLSKGMATAAPRIGDTKVEMSPLEQGNYINYQRIEDNLSVVRSRCVIQNPFEHTLSFTITKRSGSTDLSRYPKRLCMVTWMTLTVKILSVVSATSSCDLTCVCLARHI